MNASFSNIAASGEKYVSNTPGNGTISQLVFISFKSSPNTIRDATEYFHTMFMYLQLFFFKVCKDLIYCQDCRRVKVKPVSSAVHSRGEGICTRMT